MRFFILLIPFLLLSACLSSSMAHISTVGHSPKPTETFMPPAPMILQRGINLGNMLEAPKEGEWGLYVKKEYFDLIKQAGFDFVRLPVRWNTHAQVSAPYRIDPDLFTRVDQIVGWASERNLAIILDFHHYDEMMTDPQGNKDRYLAIWKQIAEHYRDYPANVLFELLNEPNNQIGAAVWNRDVSEALAIVRESNPSRDVIFGPVNSNAYDWLSTLDVPNDEHLIVTFHYYEPFRFTHQGAEWVDGSNAWMGTTWDATDDQKAAVISNFDSAAEWARRHGNIRILLGEFGAYSKASQDSRVRWTIFVREQAEAHGFAWSYWEFNAGFGVYDPNANVWRDDLLKALIP
jgi:Endoglucanase